MQNSKKITDWLCFQCVRPWWLRMLLLLIAGLPLFTWWPATRLQLVLESFLPAGQASFLVFPVITFYIWLVCLPSLGSRKMLDYLAAAFGIALTTVVSGAIIRICMPFLFSENHLAGQLRLLKLYFNILAVFPYSMTFLNSFSVSGLMTRLTKSRGKFRETGLHLALALRICQHVGEVIPKLLLVWREDHPELLLPRFRQNWHGVAILLKWPAWIVRSLAQWIFACIILTFEPIPVMVNEIEQIDESRDSDATD